MQVFSRAANFVPFVLAAALGIGGGAAMLGIWYYWSPKNLQVGYAPEQPIPYSHKLHVDELGIDCRYCHASVERSQEAMIPSTDTCLGCHALVKADSSKLKALRASWDSNEAVPWVRVHKLPDHVFFDHSVHVAKGVGCVSCHGRIDQMEVVRLDQPISMGWCLECHRDPTPNLRPPDQVTNMTWSADESADAGDDVALADVQPPEHCSGCHR